MACNVYTRNISPYLQRSSLNWTLEFLSSNILSRKRRPTFTNNQMQLRLNLLDSSTYNKIPGLPQLIGHSATEYSRRQNKPFNTRLISYNKIFPGKEIWNYSIKPRLYRYESDLIEFYRVEISILELILWNRLKSASYTISITW